MDKDNNKDNEDMEGQDSDSSDSSQNSGKFLVFAQYKKMCLINFCIPQWKQKQSKV